ncbi:unnamed protein product, partial [Mesorhabditis belari]|uniref:SSD domain-containing protein n=1 Tax=Mesorhabditis belari TaxID=2138241 RepID=A0AAF3EAF4_9BILA
MYYGVGGSLRAESPPRHRGDGIRIQRRTSNTQNDNGPPQAKPPLTTDSRFNSLNKRSALNDLPVGVVPAQQSHSTSTTTSNTSSSYSSSTGIPTSSAATPNEGSNRTMPREMETQEMRTSYVEEPPSPATLRRQAKGAAAALVRRVTNEMALAHFVQKVEINEEENLGAYRLTHWPERVMRQVFWYLGKALANHNTIFAVFPLVLVALSLVAPIVYWDKLYVGLPFSTLVEDRDMTSSGVGMRRMAVPQFNSTNPSYSALDRMNHHAYAVLFKNRNANDTILREETIATYLNMKTMIQSIGFHGKTWPELCGGNSCSFGASILDKIVKKSSQIALTYPETYVSLSKEDSNLTRVFLASIIGGVDVDVDGAIASAQSLLASFELNRALSTPDTLLWEKAFIQKVEGVKKENSDFEVNRWSYEEFAGTVIQALQRCHLWIGASAGIIFILLLLSMCRLNAYQSKPIVGLAAGVVLCGSAIAGVCVSLSGSTFLNPLQLPVLFVIIGIGACYCEALHTAWRKFSAVALHPSEKIALVMAYEGTFICASSLLLIAMFVGAGLLSATPYVQTAFLTMAAGIAALLLLTLLFLAVFVFKSGRREAKGCKWFHFCRSGDTHFPTPNIVDFDNKQLEHLHGRLVDTKASPSRQFAAWLLGPSLRYPLVFLCTIYLLLAAWGCVHIKIDLREEHFLPSQSEARKFLENFYQLFGKTQEYLEVTIEQTIDYQDADLRKSIVDLLEQPVKNEYATRAVSWIADFGRFEKSSAYEINQDTFVHVVRLVFLVTDPFQRYTSDIYFDRFQTQIIRSRMYLELNPKGVLKRREVIESLLEKARSMQLPISVKAPFVFSIQHDLQSLSTALFAFGVFLSILLVISLALFGQPSLTFVVVATSLCVLIETVGYASHWGVPLNTITLTMAICANSLSCVVAISFCYAYSNSGNGLRPIQRVQYTFQSCLLPLWMAITLPVLTYLPLLCIDAPIILHIWRILLLNAIASLAHLLLFLPNAVTLLNENACTALSSVFSGADDESSIYYIPTAGRIIPTEGIYQTFTYPMPKIAPPPSYLAIGAADPIYGRYEPNQYGRMRIHPAEASLANTPQCLRAEERRRGRRELRDLRDVEGIYETPPSPMHRTTREEIIPPRTGLDRIPMKNETRPNERNPRNEQTWRQLLSEPTHQQGQSSQYFSYNKSGF